MTSVRRLSRLFNAISLSQFSKARELALQIAADEEGKGHHAAALLLRSAIGGNGQIFGQPVEIHPPPTQSTALFSALSPVRETLPLAEIALRDKWRSEISVIESEWKNRDRLAAKQIKRRSKLLFHGPPGCGKSLTAASLGAELSLPTFVIRFDAVVGAYLGQTAVHLRELFQYAEANRCVLVFDEIDALGKKRGNPLDVGELDRIVIALMQELEHSNPAGLVIATSNLPAHLDDALWRRFDLIIEFPRPTKQEMLNYSARLAASHRLALTMPMRRSVARAKSYADAERIIDDVRRKQAISDTEERSNGQGKRRK